MEKETEANFVKIAVIGPESTGKTTLAGALSEFFDEPCVPEYAREFLEQLNRFYLESDLLTIAKGQLKQEEEWAQHADRLLICDTNLTVIKIWSEYVFERCDPWIDDQVENTDYTLTFLTDIDVPWEFDPLREHPEEDDRKELFHRYKSELTRQKTKFEILSGPPHERFEKAKKMIQALLKFRS